MTEKEWLAEEAQVKEELERFPLAEQVRIEVHFPACEGQLSLSLSEIGIAENLDFMFRKLRERLAPLLNRPEIKHRDAAVEHFDRKVAAAKEARLQAEAKAFEIGGAATQDVHWDEAVMEK